MRAARAVLSVSAGALAGPWCVTMNEFTHTTIGLPKKQAMNAPTRVPTTVTPGIVKMRMPTTTPAVEIRMTSPRPNF